MYPGTIFNWFDQSEINQSTAPVELDNSPLFISVGSFDKGPEKLMEVDSNNFNKLFGTMNFAKHGQNAIQTQRIIDAGGRVLIKRVCANDSKIANLVMVANVTVEETQKTDADGNLIYLDTDGSETTSVTDNPVMIKSASVKWEAKNISECSSFEKVKEEALKLLNIDAGVFPLFVIADNGRGTSKKALRLIPDYNTSKNIGKMFYTASVYEGTSSIESVPVSVDPSVTYSGDNYGLDKESMVQLDAEVIDTVYDAFVEKIAESIDADVNVITNYDLVYGYTYSGDKIPNYNIASESVDFNSDYGIELKNGSNGAFGDAPVNKPEWVEAICSVYRGDVTEEIWDVDQHMVAAVCDANFPVAIKNEIANFVNFRKDCVFFRDFGTDINTFDDIVAAYEANNIRSKFIADYATCYTVKDPLTKKNIRVTMMYDLVECLVNNFSSGVANPVAGSANGFILKSAIKGTVNFVPIVTPKVNRKKAIDDMRVNYAIFENDDCVVQSLYTSQDKYTELSFINNVLAIQEVARAVRSACPKQRFTTVSGFDMTSYAKAVNNVLINFTGNFSTLRFNYTTDKLKASQKIFYASIEFAFNQWAQTEVFDLFAINNLN